jgi:type VI protein secretion system component VasK
VTNPATGVEINPDFLRFFNAAEKVSSALFPGGTTQPTLTFTLTEGKTVPDAVLNIDGQQVAAGKTAPFRWVSQPTSKITLTSSLNSTTYSGPWSVFHLGLDASLPSLNSFVFGLGPNGHISETVRFDAEGSGAPLLNPSFMGQLQHCVASVAKP